MMMGIEKMIITRPSECAIHAAGIIPPIRFICVTLNHIHFREIALS
jgi:hypothetical protein